MTRLNTTEKTARQILDSKITEKDFQNQVIELFQRCGWLVNHQRPAMVKDDRSPTGYSYRTAIQGDKGFLDTVATKGGYIVLAEVKKESGELSPDQKRWFAMLKLVEAVCYPYVRVFKWKPSDWDLIERIAKEE